MPLQHRRLLLLAAVLPLEGVVLLHPGLVGAAVGLPAGRKKMNPTAVHEIGLEPREDRDVESGEIVAAVDVVPLVVGQPLLVEEPDDGLHAGGRDHLRHHDDVGGERLDHRGHPFEVAAAGGLEPESSQLGVFAGGREIFGIEADDPQSAGGGRRGG